MKGFLLNVKEGRKFIYKIEPKTQKNPCQNDFKCTFKMVLSALPNWPQVVTLVKIMFCEQAAESCA